MQGGRDLVERETDALRRLDESDTSQGRTSEAPLPAGRPLRRDEPARFVEAERGRRDAASARELPDRDLRVESGYVATITVDLKGT